MRDKLYFSIVWEDFILLNNALQFEEGDVVVSIASAGDNICNIATKNPQLIYAVDTSLRELSLCKEKIERIKKQEYSDIIEDLEMIGLFESKIVPLIRFFLKSVISNKDVFHKKNLSLQRKMYEKNKWRLSLMTYLFSSKYLYKLVITPVPLNKLNINRRLSFKKNIRNFFYFNDFSRNWYLQRLVLGKYIKYPLFFDKQIKTDIRLKNKDILSFLEALPENHVNKINLSDIFEWSNDDYFKTTLLEALRVTKKDGRILFRELFITRDLSFLDKSTCSFEEVEQAKDNVPFYFRTIVITKN